MSKTELTAIAKDYKEENVVEAAKERLRFIFNNYDDWVVNYSGGKDSQTVLVLAREVMQEMGIKKKLKVSFFDEEFIYPETEENVKALFAKDWVEGYWICALMDYGLVTPDGSSIWIKIWDKNRRLVRPMPENALTNDTIYSTACGEEIDDAFVFNKPEDKGKRICEIIGLRSDESLFRRFIITNNHRSREFCYLMNTTATNIFKAVPIYDWSETDVFHYLRDTKDIMEINQLYFKEALSKQPLRVGPSIHSRRKLELPKIREENPSHYYALIEAFPHLSTTSRYVNSLTKFGSYDAVIEKYGLTLRGMKQMIIDNVPDIDIRMRGFRSLKTFNTRYLVGDRFKRYGHTYESAMRVALIYFSKGSFSKPVTLRKK